MTPLLRSLYLDNGGIGDVYLKLENEQHTGSFKWRGAINKVLSLSNAERQRGIVTASTGNHGQAVARALQITGTNGTIFLPKNVDASKLEAIRQYGTHVQFFGMNVDTELEAKRVAKEQGKVWISPYNDPQVIGGQGTIGVELLQQLPTINTVFVTVGGGGLISGISTYLKRESPQTKIIGCLPENSAEMYHCVQAGKFVQVESRETISDGSAGGFEEGSITFDICRQLIDDYALVSEEEIKNAMRFVVDRHHKIIEGSAGVALAGWLKNRDKHSGNTIIVLCGGNIATEKLKSLL